ncbi:MAG: hypothetical protein ABIT71_02050 [Vicinamibacteraceae bacterium]
MDQGDERPRLIGRVLELHAELEEHHHRLALAIAESKELGGAARTRRADTADGRSGRRGEQTTNQLGSGPRWASPEAPVPRTSS